MKNLVDMEWNGFIYMFHVEFLRLKKKRTEHDDMNSILHILCIFQVLPNSRRHNDVEMSNEKNAGWNVSTFKISNEFSMKVLSAQHKHIFTVNVKKSNFFFVEMRKKEFHTRVRGKDFNEKIKLHRWKLLQRRNHLRIHP